jgi:hypothetical protein
MNAATMPALGAQLGSMISYVEACSREPTCDQSEVNQTWGHVYGDIAVPFGIETDKPLHGEGVDRVHHEVITPLVREKFDTRIATLFQEPVTKLVIESQKIDPKQIKVARDLQIVSEGPANALIQSAMQVSAVGRSRMLQTGSAEVLFLFINAMSQFGSAFYGVEAGNYFYAGCRGALAIASLVILGVLIKRDNSFDKANDENFREIRKLVNSDDGYPVWPEMPTKPWRD